MKYTKLLLLLFFVPVLVLSACGPAATPTTTPNNWHPAGSVTLVGGGWTNVVTALGVADKYLVNGVERSYNTGSFTEGDVVSLVNCPQNASSECIKAREQDFADTNTELEYKMSGFQNPITPERVEKVLLDACVDINLTRALGHDRADGLTLGCEYYTAAKYMYSNGTGACIPAIGYEEMQTRILALDLAQIKSLVFLASPVTTNQSDPSLCSR